MKNNYAEKPPLGWNSWDCFGTGVNEDELLANAEYMRDNLLSHGWEYIVCDVQWSEPNAVGGDYNHYAELDMDGFSRLIPSVKRFPSAAGGKGFKPIADKIHAMGLKFGIHIMRGIPRQAVHRNTKLFGIDKTAREIAHPFSVCAWNTDMYGIDTSKEGAYEYYKSLIELYVSWGVDLIKCDDIANIESKPWDPYCAKGEIELLRRAIDESGAEIVLSLSPGPAPLEFAEHLSENSNMWRLTGDVWDRWESVSKLFERCEKWYPYVKPGSWPDCDMLPFGKLAVKKAYCGEKGRYCRLTHGEQRTVMSLWCIFRSPLMFGGNMPENDAFTLSLLTNDELLDINQNGENPHPIYNDGNIIVWTSNLREKKVLAVFNVSEEEKEYTFELSKLSLKKAEARDVWRHINFEETENEIKFKLQPHESEVLLLG